MKAKKEDGQKNRYNGKNEQCKDKSDRYWGKSRVNKWINKKIKSKVHIFLIYELQQYINLKSILQLDIIFSILNLPFN